MVCVNPPDWNVEDVLAIEVHGADPVTDDSQFKIVPLCPDKVNKPLELPAQIDALPLKVPANETGFTLMLKAIEFPIHPW